MSGPIHVPDKTAIHYDLERAQREFHQLVEQVGQWEWYYRDLRVSDFSIGELLAHMQHMLAVVPRQVEAVRGGRNFWHLPRWLYNPLRLLSARWFAWWSSPKTIGKRYDEAHAAALAALESIQPEEWQRGSYFFDEGYCTIEEIFRHQSNHVAEHAVTVRRLLASRRTRRFGYG